jgi:hypothetical protein
VPDVKILLDEHNILKNPRKAENYLMQLFLNNFGISYINQPRAHKKSQCPCDNINTQDDVTGFDGIYLSFKFILKKIFFLTSCALVP